MSDNMSLSVNGQSQVPPGFRFHPTEEELLHYYLRKKVAFEKIDLDVIREVDLNKLEPWDIQEKCRIGSTPQNDWYFFSHKDKKYPTGTRTNRATTAGFWKATGRDKVIYSSLRRIGMRKTLVFYLGRAPHGQKSDWIMHEYRLDDNSNPNANNVSDQLGDSMQEDGWVVCRVFRKKNYQRALESPKSSSATSIASRSAQLMMLESGNDEVLDQILLYMGKNCKQENEISNNISNNNSMLYEGSMHERFMHLPRLDSPNLVASSMPKNNINSPSCYQLMDEIILGDQTHESNESCLNDWVALDRLVASQLNGQVETSKQYMTSSCFSDDPNNMVFNLAQEQNDVQLSSQVRSTFRSNQDQDDVYSSEIGLWRLNRPSSSSSDPLSHLSV